MYTCDICGHDVGSPENLCRVWEGDQQEGWDAILVCYDCMEQDGGVWLRDAEDDPTWDYPKHIRFRVPS